MRLDKFLSECSLCTRSESKALIKKGAVAVNGKKADRGDMKIDPENDDIVFKGEKVQYSQFEYYMLNKPAGVVSATEDKNDKTVIDLVPKPHAKDIFPVGRLDKDTEGLLIITNDGELAHNLLSPKKHVDKTYFVRTQGGAVNEKDVEAFKDGVDIGENTLTLPAELKIIKSGEISESELTIREGKFHQVKRMFKAVGKEVIYLKRISMGGLVLDEGLEKGECRRLSEEEIKTLK
jgi:16S rRNA pseudouridine516 synthase